MHTHQRDVTDSVARALDEAGVDLITLSMDGATPRITTGSAAMPGLCTPGPRPSATSSPPGACSARAATAPRGHAHRGNVDDVAGIIECRPPARGHPLVSRRRICSGLSQPSAAGRRRCCAPTSGCAKRKMRVCPTSSTSSRAYLFTGGSSRGEARSRVSPRAPTSSSTRMRTSTRAFFFQDGAAGQRPGRSVREFTAQLHVPSGTEPHVQQGVPVRRMIQYRVPVQPFR